MFLPLGTTPDQPVALATVAPSTFTADTVPPATCTNWLRQKPGMGVAVAGTVGAVTAPVDRLKSSSCSWFPPTINVDPRGNGTLKLFSPKPRYPIPRLLGSEIMRTIWNVPVPRSKSNIRHLILNVPPPLNSMPYWQNSTLAYSMSA